METLLIAKALRMAPTLRGEVPDGVALHADQGTEFTSNDMYQTYQNLEILQPVGQTGVCWNNAMASKRVGEVEDFNSTTVGPGPPELRRG